WEKFREQTRITLSSVREAALPWYQRVAKVRLRDAYPAVLQLDADAAPVERSRFDQRRADAAHRIDNEVARLRVRKHDPPGELREHLPWMPNRLRDIAAAPLLKTRRLRAWPDGERDRFGERVADRLLWRCH